MSMKQSAQSNFLVGRVVCSRKLQVQVSQRRRRQLAERFQWVSI